MVEKPKQVLVKFSKPAEISVVLKDLHYRIGSDRCPNLSIFEIFSPSSAEAALRDCERLSALVDLQCVPASGRVQEGVALGGLPRTGHAAGHPAGHPMCLWHCQGSQAACHHHHKGEYQLTALTGLQSSQHLSFCSYIYFLMILSVVFVFVIYACIVFLIYEWIFKANSGQSVKGKSQQLYLGIPSWCISTISLEVK